MRLPFPDLDPSRTPRPARRLCPLVFCAVLGLALPADAGGTEVWIVLSSDAKPYDEAGRELARRLKEQGHAVATARLDQLKAQDFAAFGRKSHALAVGVGSEATQALDRDLPSAIPLAFCMVKNAEGLQLKKERASAGVEIEVSSAHQASLIAEALPAVRTVGVIYKSSRAEAVEDFRRRLPAGWKLESVDADKFDSFARALDRLFESKPDVIWTHPDPNVFSAASVRVLLLEALRRKVPVFGFSIPFVKAGALLGIGIEPSKQGAQAAELAAELLAAQGPLSKVVSPRFEIGLNLVVAEKVSVRLPERLVERADTVVGKP